MKYYQICHLVNSVTLLILPLHLKMISTSTAHNKGGPTDINIAQILYLSNFLELKRRIYIHLQA
jgi:hypothetical protein